MPGSPRQPDSPLYQDLQQVRAALGAEKFRVSYSGGSRSAVMEMLAGSDSLTTLPGSVVFSLRRQYPVSALPIRIAHPNRNPGQLSRDQPTLSPADRRLRRRVIGQSETLSQTILHHERQSLWRR